MIHDSFQISIYPRGGRGKDSRWEWVVYDLDGITPLRRGETTGAESHAKSAANNAAHSLYLERRNQSKQ